MNTPPEKWTLARLDNDCIGQPLVSWRDLLDLLNDPDLRRVACVFALERNGRDKSCGAIDVTKDEAIRRATDGLAYERIESAPQRVRVYACAGTLYFGAPL